MKQKTSKSKKAKSQSSGTLANVGGMQVNLGDLSGSMEFGGSDSDSDDSFGAILEGLNTT
mgnify:FL=1